MSLSAIGPYQVKRHLGRGGMGEVFLAHDTRLDRQVAIKALPAHLAQDPDRLARFQREAKVLASLSHPGIAGIYGLEEAEGRSYLILEFVHGETLADRLGNGPVPVQESLAFARQIADAVEAAHEKGVVHRDLKPANVMVTPEGVVKVLDFGLARTAEGPASSAAGFSESPTVPLRSPTIPGAIMGTAGYMSPEQARGRTVDKRSDIFSFGCILYEMLSGSGPFPGETVTDSLGAIIHREPDWGLLPAATPARIRDLLRSCLAKDRRERLHDIGDARLELDRAIAGHEWTAAPSAASAAAPRWRTPAALLAAGALIGGGLLAAGLLQRHPPAAPAIPLSLAAPLAARPAFDTLIGIAPDGRFLVYKALPELAPDSVKPTGVLVVRRLDRDETTVLEGTEGIRDAALSPDGRWVAFSGAKDRTGDRLTMKRIGLDGGRPIGRPETVCDLPQGAAPVLCWASDRDIAFSNGWAPSINLVSASGGEPRVVHREDLPKGIESWADLRPLVPGRSILATRWSFVGQKVRVATEMIDLASGERRVILPEAGNPTYIPPGPSGGPGVLVAARVGLTTLIAARFDPASGAAAGEPITVWSGNPISGVHVSPSGTLAVTTRPADVLDRTLAWIDEKGQPQPIPGTKRSYGNIFTSPDGARVLAAIDAAGSAELTSETWVHDLNRKTAVRIPLQGAMLDAAWTNDGQSFAYGLARDGAFAIWKRAGDGSGEPVQIVTSPGPRTLVVPTRWTPDDALLAYVQVDMADDSGDVYLASPTPGGGPWTTKPYLRLPGNEEICRFSPDGHWVLYWSTQSGRRELFLQRFTGDAAADAAAGRRQVSPAGIAAPRPWWSPDGKEIRFVDTDQQLMSVQVTLTPDITIGDPKPLYSLKNLKTRDLTFGADGRLLVILQGESEQTTMSIGIVVNFLDDLRTKLSATH